MTETKVCYRCGFNFDIEAFKVKYGEKGQSELAKKYWLKDYKNIKQIRKEYRLKEAERLKKIKIESRLREAERVKEWEKEYSLREVEKIKEWKREFPLIKNRDLKLLREEYRIKELKKIRRKQKEYLLKADKSIEEWVRNYPLRENSEITGYYFREAAKIRKEQEKREYYLREDVKKRRKERMETDVVYALKMRLRVNISSSFNRRGHKKFSMRTEEIVGIDFEGFKAYIESKFRDGMSWENRSEWHLDHIIPISLAETEEDVIRLCHYTNYQPLWAIDNIRKGNKIIKSE